MEFPRFDSLARCADLFHALNDVLSGRPTWRDQYLEEQKNGGILLFEPTIERTVAVNSLVSWRNSFGIVSNLKRVRRRLSHSVRVYSHFDRIPDNRQRHFELSLTRISVECWVMIAICNADSAYSLLVHAFDGNETEIATQANAFRFQMHFLCAIFVLTALCMRIAQKFDVSLRFSRHTCCRPTILAQCETSVASKLPATTR